MTKNDLARELAVSEGLHLSTAVKAIDGTIRILKESLAKGEDITLRGFGTLSITECAERTIPAHRSVKFRISKELKEQLNNGAVD